MKKPYQIRQNKVARAELIAKGHITPPREFFNKIVDGLKEQGFHLAAQAIRERGYTFRVSSL